uniref:Reverse transcriptase domain-containing protein n=1 Tax=Trichogramma kaykai TaxID=54128 RepID=A0ABD2W7Y3_9HYME
MQELFGSKLSAAAKLVLDGPIRSVFPSMEEMVSIWEPILTTPSKELDGVTAVEDRDLQWIVDPVSMRELLACEMPFSSAPGPDSITSRQWRSIPISLRALFLNVILALGGFPSHRLLSRTIFIPKKDGSSLPSEFRPISVSSVVVRHLHKVFASRLMRANLVDERQRGMHVGCAENITVLSTILRDAKSSLKELHVVSLDVAKAFDSVSHHAITSTLKRLGLPSAFVRYIEDTYRNSSTVLTIKRSKSEPIRVTRGVRQGDPLSSLLFSLVVDRVLTSLPSSVGYHLGEHKIDALVYADDIMLFSSSILGTKEMLRTAGDEASKYGLQFNAAKCIAMSILIAAVGRRHIKCRLLKAFRLAEGLFVSLALPSTLDTLGCIFLPLVSGSPGVL